MVMTAAPADTVKVMSHLMLPLYSLEFSNSGINVIRPKSPRLLDFGTIVRLVDVDIPGSGDLSSILGVGAMLRDVAGVEGSVFISLAGAFKGTSFLDALSMALVRCILRSIGHETGRDRHGYVIDLCAERSCQARF